MSFLPVPQYEGFYEISDQGVVQSVDRIVIGVDGVRYLRTGRVLRSSPHKDLQYLVVSLWKNNKGQTYYVHRLVAQTHIPNPQNLPEVNHLDGNRQNNLVRNLEWTTCQGNILHAIQTGLKTYTNRLTKQEFVACLFDVLNGESYHSLTQRVPYKVPFLSTKLRKIARELGIEHELNESLTNQRIERARINGAKNH